MAIRVICQFEKVGKWLNYYYCQFNPCLLYIKTDLSNILYIRVILVGHKHHYKPVNQLDTR